jgi:hypothetical protein
MVRTCHKGFDTCGKVDVVKSVHIYMFNLGTFHVRVGHVGKMWQKQVAHVLKYYACNDHYSNKFGEIMIITTSQLYLLPLGFIVDLIGWYMKSTCRVHKYILKYDVMVPHVNSPLPKLLLA